MLSNSNIKRFAFLYWELLTFLLFLSVRYEKYVVMIGLEALHREISAAVNDFYVTENATLGVQPLPLWLLGHNT